MEFRRRLPVVALAVALWGTSAYAAPKAWVDPTEINLGVIDEGKSFERYVELKNVGDGTLILEDLKTSCGCTAAAVDSKVELTGGKSEKVRITFNSKGMDGSIKKTVTLTTNDPEARNLEINIHADVHRAVRFEPKYLQCDVNMKDPWEQAVKLESDVPLALHVKKAFVLGGTKRDEPSKLFDATVGAATKEGERDVHEIKVRLKTPAKAQRISEVLTILTDRPAPDDTLEVAIRGEIKGRIHVSSGFVVLRSVDPGEASRTDVTLSTEEGTFKVLGAEVADGKVDTKIYPSEGGKQTVVSLTYVGQEAGANGVRTLTIKTDDPDQSTIEIPVRYQTRAAGAKDGKGANPGTQSFQSVAPGAQKKPNSSGEQQKTDAKGTTGK